MLNSQITLSARNIPTYAATIIRTKVINQVMDEDRLLNGPYVKPGDEKKPEKWVWVGWKIDAKLYQNNVEKHHPHTGRKIGSASASGTIGSQVLDVLSETEWMTVTQVRDQLGFGYNKARNALDRLVTRREVDRRIVPTADGMRKRALFRINAKAAYRRKRDEETLQFLAEPRTTSEVAEFAGLSPQRASYMLGEWFEAGEIERDWKPDHTGRNKSLWRRKEGGE